MSVRYTPVALEEDAHVHRTPVPLFPGTIAFLFQAMALSGLVHLAVRLIDGTRGSYKYAGVALLAAAVICLSVSYITGSDIVFIVSYGVGLDLLIAGCLLVAAGFVLIEEPLAVWTEIAANVILLAAAVASVAHILRRTDETEEDDRE